MTSNILSLALRLDSVLPGATKRAALRGLIVVFTLLLSAAAVSSLAWGGVALAGANAALLSSGARCTGPTTYGSQCIDVSGSGSQVTRIRTSFRGLGLAGEKWRIDLERYSCDPVGKTKSSCPVAATWHGKLRTGRPAGRQQVSFTQSRTSRYWTTFYSLPHTFSAKLWLCTELAFYNSSAGKWVYNAAGLPAGLRACVSVHHS